jgi:hypothetical protein
MSILDATTRIRARQLHPSASRKAASPVPRLAACTVGVGITRLGAGNDWILLGKNAGAVVRD